MASHTFNSGLSPEIVNSSRLRAIVRSKQRSCSLAEAVRYWHFAQSACTCSKGVIA
ncbi:Uncharacterised protein [Vibrio cholerae]|nr:Uncharacterised protein [Vibrio cholerae]